MPPQPRVHLGLATLVTTLAAALHHGSLRDAAAVLALELAALVSVLVELGWNVAEAMLTVCLPKFDQLLISAMLRSAWH